MIGNLFSLILSDQDRTARTATSRALDNMSTGLLSAILRFRIPKAKPIQGIDLLF